MSRKLAILLSVIVIFAIAFAIRVYKINSSPSGTLVDEASFGYNAYSILQTGKDEYGIKMPLVFKAFGDQKLPIYAYSIVPFIKIFGLNNLTVRMPSVIAGSILGIVMLFLLMELGYNLKYSFLGSLIAVTSPWSLMLSRFGYESNVALLFFSAGILLTLYSFRKRSMYLATIGGLLLGLTWYSYIAYRLVTPLILVVMLVLYFVKHKRITKEGLALLIMFIIIVSPIIAGIFSREGTARLHQTSFTTDLGIVMSINENRSFCVTQAPKLICYLISNKPVSYIYTLISRYIRALSSDYLFITGDKSVTYMNVDNYGLFYIVYIPMYFLGAFSLFRKLIERKLTKSELLLFAGLIIAPIPSILAGDPQKVRLSPLFPFTILALVIGFSFFDSLIKPSLLKRTVYLLTMSTIVGFAIFFMVNFITVHTQKYEVAYGSYILKLMRYLGRQDKKTKIYIKPITEAIILYAFDNKINPNLYQKSVVRSKPDSIGFAQPIQLENIEVTDNDITKVYCLSKKNREMALYVTNDDFRNRFGKEQYKIQSDNGVYTYAFIYNLNEFDPLKFDCDSVQ